LGTNKITVDLFFYLSQVREEDKEEGEGTDNEKEKESSGEDGSDTETRKNAIHANVSEYGLFSFEF
jgi:hypothetical protein